MSTAGINLLNIGLMVASLGAAIWLPFQTFLFSYAVLGPLHYLTEMSWLHDRKYFLPSRRQAVPITILALVSLVSAGVFPALKISGAETWNAETVFGALALALVFVVAKTRQARVVGVGVVLLALVLGHHFNGIFRGVVATSQVSPGYYTAITPYDVFFMIFVTTIIHVFVFTALFVLYGAMRSQSRTGYLSLFVLVACALLCFLIPVLESPELTDYVRDSYDLSSTTVNLYLAEYSGFGIPNSQAGVFGSERGIMVGRLIAYAYTYHYLNWFSKTSIIKWHEVPRSRLAVVVVIWIASLILYGIEYSLGLQWLFFLSMLHVFLEFPLNWHSFFGIFAELKKRALPT